MDNSLQIPTLTFNCHIHNLRTNLCIPNDFPIIYFIPIKMAGVFRIIIYVSVENNQDETKIKE